jgi:hypothetical protein
VDSGAGHALAQTAGFEEVLLKAAELPVQKEICLVDQADGDIGHDCCGAGFYEIAVILERLFFLLGKPADVLGFL